MHENKERHRLGFKQGFFAVLAIVLVSICLVPNPAYSLPAFPRAEGFGSTTVGGRSGKVIEVTNLNDSGTGSLRACIGASGARTCVFRVGGTITLSSGLTITNPYITIAGQTAPGGGITIKGGDLRIATHDVVVRYLTSRRGSGGTNHALVMYSNGSTNLYNIVVDHCSLSWGTDETTETWYGPRDVTYQWSIISEGLDCSTHPKGCHSKGALLGGPTRDEAGTALGSEKISFHHNLLAHNGERGPMVKSSGIVDVVNNVSYNPYWTFSHVYISSKSIPQVNFVGNYFKKGPDSTSNYEFRTVNEGGYGTSIYYHGNIGPTRTADTLDDWYGLDSTTKTYLTKTKHSTPAITTTSALDAYTQVLNDAGNNKGLDCSGNFYIRRDSVDQRIINDVKNRTGKIIDSPSEVGGWPSIASGTACADSDHDGMPDQWEKLYGFNPANAADGTLDADGDGYTNLEEFLNSTNPHGSSASSTASTVAPATPNGLKVIAN